MVIFQPAMRLTTQSLIKHFVARESLSDTCFFIAGIINPLCLQIWHFEQIKRMQMSSYVQKVQLWFAHRGQLQQLSIFILERQMQASVSKMGSTVSHPGVLIPLQSSIFVSPWGLLYYTFRFEEGDIAELDWKCILVLLEPHPSSAHSFNRAIETRLSNVSHLTGKGCLMRPFGFYANYISSCCENYTRAFEV